MATGSIPDVVEVVTRGGRSRPLEELLQEVGAPTSDQFEEYASQIANLQEQIDTARADTQRLVDELREHVDASH